jgi:hypothetical protein
MSADAMAALANSDWADVCRGLDMLVAMQDKAMWARLATGVSYKDGVVSFAENAEIARIMWPPRLDSGSSRDSRKILRLAHVVVGLHALFQGDVLEVRKLDCEDVDDLWPLLRLPALEELNVSGDDVDIEPLGRLPALRDLSMHRFGALSHEPGVRFIENLRALRSLTVDLSDGSSSGNSLAGIEALQGHPTLQELCLCWWTGGDEDLPIIASSPCLQSLVLVYADELYDYSALRSARVLKHLTLDLSGRVYGGLACLAHLHERGGLTLEDEWPAGVTTAIDLSAFQSLSRAAVAELKLCDQTVVLNGLSCVSSEAVETLAANGRNLYFDGLKSLDVSLARILSRHTGYLSLRGVKTLDDEAAALIAERSAWFCLALPGSVSIEIQKTIRENPWYISPDACHWPIAAPCGDFSPECRADDAVATVLTAEETLKVRTLLESGEANGVSLALALMAHVGPEGWGHVFDSATLGRVAETWNPEIWGQLCEFCPSEDVLQAFIVAVARRLAAKSLEVDEPSEHVEFLETLDCDETPAFLRAILRMQVPTGEESEEEDSERDDDEDEEDEEDEDEDDDDSEPGEPVAVRKARTRPWFL